MSTPHPDNVRPITPDTPGLENPKPNTEYHLTASGWIEAAKTITSTENLLIAGGIHATERIAEKVAAIVIARINADRDIKIAELGTTTPQDPA
jgi:succinylglutamate desuccinylase